MASSDDERDAETQGEALVPFTVRRPVVKVGRNDPCHCGSGKKYKRCCLEKDRARLSDPSPYAGLTMEEAKRDPTRHGDPAIFLEMNKEELDATARAPLPPDLLRGLAHAYSGLGELAAASTVLGELAGRIDGGEESPEVASERDALVYEALRRGDRKRARAEIALRRGAVTFEAQLNQLTLDLANRPPEKLVRVESYLRQLIDDPRDLTELADAVALAGYPGLTVALARAAAVLGGSADDRSVLEDLLYSERERLKLPERDAALRLLSAAGPRPQRVRRSDEELAALRGRLGERDAAIQKVRSERDRLAGELEKQSVLAAAAVAASTMPATSDEDTRRLRRKVEELQAELTNKQRDREELQKQLRAAAHSAHAAHTDGSEARGRGGRRPSTPRRPTRRATKARASPRTRRSARCASRPPSTRPRPTSATVAWRCGRKRWRCASPRSTRRRGSRRRRCRT